MDKCWAVIYWSSFVLGSVFTPFFQIYWTAGHFSVESRMKFAFKQLLKQAILVLTVFIAFVLAGVFMLHANFLTVAKASVLVMSNLYGMVVQVLLLSYGITFLPWALWHRIDAKSVLYEVLSESDEIFRSYRDARLDFHTEVSICQNLISNNTTGFNKEFMDVLKKEIPTEDLDGDTIHTSRAFMVEVKKGRSVDESFIAERRNNLKLKYFLYKRKKARW